MNMLPSVRKNRSSSCPDETVEVKFDLSSFTENGEYIFTFQLHTELGETYFVRVCLNTEEFEKKGNYGNDNLLSEI